jgi:hypothetical protein
MLGENDRLDKALKEFLAKKNPHQNSGTSLKSGLRMFLL